MSEPNAIDAMHAANLGRQERNAQEVERAARIGYETMGSRLTAELRATVGEFDWETETDECRDDWRAVAEEILIPVRADRDRLLAALKHYMSQFGQGLEARGLPFGRGEQEADEEARAAIAGR